jgi:hypothetical protein
MIQPGISYEQPHPPIFYQIPHRCYDRQPDGGLDHAAHVQRSSRLDDKTLPPRITFHLFILVA